jgi:hypothetical protein
VVYVGGVYHPQDDFASHSATKIDRQWYQPVHFGDCTKPNDNVGDQFQLLIFTADQQCDKAITDYLKRGHITNLWPGMSDVEMKGCTEHGRIVVTRQ